MDNKTNYQIYTSRLKTYSTITLAGMLSTALIGSLVKAYNAGMACGTDWPHCNGALLPLDTLSSTPVLLEYIHRVVGGLTYLLAIATVMIAFKTNNKTVKIASLLALLALTVQVLLGMAVVRTYLNPFMVSFHLTFALLSIVATTFIASLAYLETTSKRC